jgi:hypothetical protein
MSYKITRKIRDIQPGETAVMIPGASGEAMLQRISIQIIDAIADQAGDTFGDRLIMLQLEVEVKHTAMVAVGDDDEPADDN